MTELAGREEAWRGFFAHPAYGRFSGAILDSARTEAEVAALRELLSLRPRMRVLDLGCGQGRISIPLARLGCRVTGLDACAPLLDRAGDAARAEGVALELLHSDMRDLDEVEAFDAVINLSTALGYVEDERDDAAALRAAHGALVPGGTFLIDTENREHTVRKSRRIWFEMAGTTVWCARSFDAMSGRWHERIQWMEGGRVDAAEFTLRLYALTELRAMLEAAGFEITGAWGGLSGEPYDLDSPRMVVRARKPR